MQPYGKLDDSAGKPLYAAMLSAVAGAAAFLPGFAAVLIAPQGLPSAPELPFALGNLLLFSAYAFAAAFIAFLVGGLALGPPIRWLLMKVGLDLPIVAFFVGALISGGTFGLLSRPTESLAWVLVGATFVAGGIAGVTYRRTATW